jgi:hypothetical protein
MKAAHRIRLSLWVQKAGVVTGLLIAGLAVLGCDKGPGPQAQAQIALLNDRHFQCACQDEKGQLPTLHCDNPNDNEPAQDFQESIFCDQASLNKGGFCTCQGTTLTCNLALCDSYAMTKDAQGKPDPQFMSSVLCQPNVFFAPNETTLSFQGAVPVSHEITKIKPQTFLNSAVCGAVTQAPTEASNGGGVQPPGKDTPTPTAAANETPAVTEAQQSCLIPDDGVCNPQCEDGGNDPRDCGGQGCGTNCSFSGYCGDSAGGWFCDAGKCDSTQQCGGGGATGGGGKP